MKCCGGWCGAGVGVGAAARLAAAAAAGFVAGVGVVHAAPVAWLNGDEGRFFGWVSENCEVCNGYEPTMLDISVGPGMTPSPERGIYRTYCCPITGGSPRVYGIRFGIDYPGPYSLEVAVPQPDTVRLPCSYFTIPVMQGVSAGATIGPGTNWGRPWRNTYFNKTSCGVENEFTGPYVGVRISIDGRWHYGWILWTPRLLDASRGTGTFPAAWALESEPDTPIRTPLCNTDHDMNGDVDFFDYLAFIEDFADGTIGGDFNRNGRLDFFDYLDFVAEFDRGCGV
jgi:hypothetical protein